VGSAVADGKAISTRSGTKSGRHWITGIAERAPISAMNPGYSRSYLE